MPFLPPNQQRQSTEGTTLSKTFDKPFIIMTRTFVWCRLQVAHYEHADAANEISRQLLHQRFRKKAAEDEQPLRQLFDDECRTSG